MEEGRNYLFAFARAANETVCACERAGSPLFTVVIGERMRIALKGGLTAAPSQQTQNKRSGSRRRRGRLTCGETDP
jgi:hypothetical protein